MDIYFATIIITLNVLLLLLEDFDFIIFCYVLLRNIKQKKIAGRAKGNRAIGQ
jgi:hypothetical protein